MSSRRQFQIASLPAARWRGHLENLLPARSKIDPVKHHAALPWRQIGAFMEALIIQEGTAALALRFVILTASRSSEALQARWAEIDLAQAAWLVPSARMKSGRTHRVPLSNEAVSVLREAAKLRITDDGDAPVFPGMNPAKPLSTMAARMLLRRMGRSETVHGFRSAFRDWCAEATNYPREVAEAALAHSLRDKTEAAYQRGDLMEKRRRLMADWATFCARTAPAGEVVPIRA
jgi:integrase